MQPTQWEQTVALPEDRQTLPPGEPAGRQTVQFKPELKPNSMGI